MHLREALELHRQRGSAILATNFYNAETLLAVLRAAREVGSAVILQTSPATIDYLGVKAAVAMARAATSEVGVSAWLHLDHARDVLLVRQCIEAGYDSVMIDASDRDFDTNVRLAREVVALAHPQGVLVEAELGYIPKLGEREVQEYEMTSPEQAEHFVRETGIDLLAVAIGNAHGFYKRQPQLDIERLKTIRQRVEAYLVLHGASGIPDDQWREAVQNGIVKVNFATEIKDTFMTYLRDALLSTDSIDIRQIFPPAMQAVMQLVKSKILLCTGQK
ncbi:MAG: class II fructose-bisphosphate aldolase [Armatimonadota bacterium]|nr:class II fructose-bisphosphate aldolase family protein [bacterium]MDW8319778.1 class II fructose-bisphosphate aldolase [Armatimonadota bacterium]